MSRLATLDSPAAIGAVSARGRDFHVALDCPVMFGRDVTHALFEPEAALADELLRANAAPGRMAILPFALSDTEGIATLRVMSDPDLSSLREVNDCYLDYCSEAFRVVDVQGEGVDTYFDLAQPERLTLERSVQVQTRTLDGLLNSHALPASFSPDVLSLDLAGTAFEALQGARTCLESQTLSVTVDAGFVSRYRGEKLFGEIHALLVSAGFQLAQFMQVDEMSTRRLAIGLRCRDLPTGARCLYLRTMHSLKQTSRDADELHVRALKLAFISVIHGQFSLAHDALHMARSSPASAELHSCLRRHSYPAFLERFEQTARRIPAATLYSNPKTAAEVFNSRMRAALEEARARPAATTRKWIPRRLRGFASRLKRASIVLWRGVAPVPGGVAPYWFNNTEMETLLSLYGFWSVAELAFKRRTRLHYYQQAGD
jgi:hypothetical protein